MHHIGAMLRTLQYFKRNLDGHTTLICDLVKKIYIEYHND